MRRRCSLCGGKLNGMICTECGLDNSKSDANYVTNQSHGDGEELTHVHGGDEDPLAGKTLTKEQRKRAERALKARKQEKKARRQTKKETRAVSYSVNGEMDKGRRFRRRVILFAVIFVLLVFGATVALIHWGASRGISSRGTPEYENWEEEYIDDYGLEEYVNEPYDEEAYELARSALAETGEAYDVTLGPGYYKAGVHIPEGLYTVEVSAVGGAATDEEADGLGTEGTLNLDDSEHGFYYSEIYTIYGSGERQRGKVELPICRGALLLIENSVQVRFVTENAALPLEAKKNPNHQSGTFSKYFVVGRDIPSGVYDVRCVEGSGIFDYSTKDKDGYETYRGLLMSSRLESGFSDVYQNVVLPSGTEVYLDGLTVSLSPSPDIESLQYNTFYPE